MVSSPEEIAYRKGWITKEQLYDRALFYGKSPYAEKLKEMSEKKKKERKISKNDCPF